MRAVNDCWFSPYFIPRAINEKKGGTTHPNIKAQFLAHVILKPDDDLTPNLKAEMFSSKIFRIIVLPAGFGEVCYIFRKTLPISCSFNLRP